MKSECLTGVFGEYISNNVYAWYGVPNVGKTLLTMTEVAGLVAQDVRVLWLDTEGGLNFDSPNGIWGTWKPRLEARFGLKDLNEAIEYHRFVSYEELMGWLGDSVEVDYGDGNKMVVKRKGKTKRGIETVYEGFGRKRDKCVVVLDSMSSLFRIEFGTNMQNFPGRADATGYLIFALNKLLAKVNAPMISTNHASLNPTNPWQFASMRGGSTASYYQKNVAYLEKPKKRALDTWRKVYAMRSPLYKEGGHIEWLRIDGERGFVLSSEAEATAAVEAAAEAKKDDDVRTT